MKVNTAKILRKLNKASFCDKKGFPEPCFRLMAMRHDDIVKIYNSVFRGLMKYYRFVDNYRRFGWRLRYVLMFSLAKLLVAKFRMRRVAAVFKKFGTRLKTLTGVGF